MRVRSLTGYLSLFAAAACGPISDLPFDPGNGSGLPAVDAGISDEHDAAAAQPSSDSEDAGSFDTGAGGAEMDAGAMVPVAHCGADGGDAGDAGLPDPDAAMSIGDAGDAAADSGNDAEASLSPYIDATTDSGDAGSAALDASGEVDANLPPCPM